MLARPLIASPPPDGLVLRTAAQATSCLPALDVRIRYGCARFLTLYMRQIKPKLIETDQSSCESLKLFGCQAELLGRSIELGISSVRQDEEDLHLILR